MEFYTYMAKLNSKRGINSVYDGDTISKLEVDLFELAQKLDENVNILRNAVKKYNETFEVKK